jgi:hypothetical protein
MESLLRTVEGDLVALQEVTMNAYNNIVASGIFAWSAFSLDLRPPQVGEKRGRHLGCAVLGQKPFQLRKYYLLENAPLPERALIVEVDFADDPFTICCFHAPPGVNWKDLKPKSLVTLANWLSSRQGPILVGLDANAPKTDHPDIYQNEWWWKDEPLLLGAQSHHHLHDVLRVWLAAHPLFPSHFCALRNVIRS